ncbi:MAG: 3-mercaptopyruvate sulfurtransferase [Hyphomonadaceae bacterium]
MTDRADDPLVTVDWLARHLEAPDLRILDATWHLPTSGRDARAEYAAKRIPGALFFDIDEICDTASPLPHMLPSPEKFASRMRKLGLGDGARLVIYDTHGLFSAARAWWMFRAMGHEDVTVLDGGLPAWEAAGQPVEEEPPLRPQERHFTARFRADLVRDLTDLKINMQKARALVIDARPAARFKGEEPEPRPNVRAGHIPDAVNVPAADMLNPDKTMKPKAALTEIFAAAGVGPKTRVICMCGSGVTAAVTALGLARIGRWDAPVYDGSWAEWGGLPDTPVATGEG